MFLKGHYQNAYVTHDLQWAMDHVGQRYGLENWITFEIELDVKTPAGADKQATKVACVWDGGLQLELIEPVSGFIDPFLPYLPQDKSDRSLRLHHVSLRRDDRSEMQAEIERLGLPFVCSGGIPDLVYTYLDARGTLGHYLEYVWATPAGWAMVGWPEGRPNL
jgi:hypothetical protein